jgi:hypothetical protein
MDRYVGLDVHAASTTMAVVGPTGRRIRSQVLDTSAGPLVEAFRGIGGERHVCLEEGLQSSWLYEALEPHATEGSDSEALFAWQGCPQPEREQRMSSISATFGHRGAYLVARTHRNAYLSGRPLA